MTPLLTAALDLAAAGYAVLPVKADGSKAPAVPTWTPYTAQAADVDQLHVWFDGTSNGLGVIMGAVSGNAELTEVEGRAAGELRNLHDLAHDSGLGALWDKVTQGWVDVSPSGGFHFHYRVDAPVPGNVKIARRPSTPEELAAWVAIETAKAHELTPEFQMKRLEKIATTTCAQVPQTLAETRGEKGYVVVAPTPGTCHETGRPWVRLIGGPDTAPTITLEERSLFHSIMHTLDETPAPAPVAPCKVPSPRASTDDGVSPGDDYEAKVDWADILTPAGWTLVSAQGATRYWRRPGKTIGVSATTAHADDRDRLYVFTSSTDFAQETPYTKFGALAVLEFGGDHSAAAKQLAADGYGQRREPGHTVDLLAGITIEGNLATVHTLPAPETRPVALVTERTLERSDDANALLLINRFGTLIRFIPERGRWVAWDGHRWQWCPAGGGEVREYAKRVARSLPEADQADRSHKKKSLSANGTTAMITQAETDDRITTKFVELDAHPYDLNTPGGIVNLRAGTLAAPDPRRLHTRMTAVTPDHGHPTPRWGQFLADTFAGADGLLPFVQRLAGYSATGSVPHHVLPFLLGPGGNGKSVFLDVMRALLGDYAATTPAKFLMANQQQHETEIARLSGLRLVIASEVNQEDRFDEAKMKLLTGGDAPTARFMRQDHFTFEPTHHLWLMGNHQPKVTTGGESFWRRLRMVEFAHVVPDDKRIDGLDRLLVAEEGPGILAWIIRGAVDVIAANDLQAPAAVMAATRTYATEEDVLARFIADRSHLGGGSAVRLLTAELRAAYTKWCAEEGERPLSPQVFGRELRTRYDIEQTRSNGRRYYVGITLYADENEPAQPDRWADR